MFSELNDEQRMLRDAVGRYVLREYDFAARTKSVAAPSGMRADVWSWFAEMGLFALPFAEASGGLAGTDVDIALVMRELGRGLMVEPWLQAVVCAGGLLEAAMTDDTVADGSNAARHAILTGVIDGHYLLALAHQESEDWSQPILATVAMTDSESGAVRLSGVKSAVPFGAEASHLIVSARVTEGADTVGSAQEGVSLFLLAADTPGVRRQGYPMQDGSRGADIVFDNVTLPLDTRLGMAGEGMRYLKNNQERMIGALCAEAVGAMEALMALTVDYLQTRRQFGQAIGRFQALQHALADMSIEVEQARSAMQLAQIALQLPVGVRRSRWLAGAKARVGKAARTVGQHAVQLHGGMGLTDECAVGHYFKRLTAIDLTFGDADRQLGRFSDMLQAA